MLISPKATDTIYQTVLHLLEQQGVEAKGSLQQSVLLRDGLFLGYRFQTATLQIDWLAQSDILIQRNDDGGILLQKQLSSRNVSGFDLPLDNDPKPVAA
jgi:4-hydroxyphenylpyruvate dioxygenase-like putative hemolysin